ncbi:MAPEG family protein [Roseibium sp. M-1]
MPVSVTPFIAGLLALLYLLLSARVIAVRKSERIGIGDKGNLALLRRMRVHSNFAEYVPIALLLLLMLEMMGGAPWLLWTLGAALLAGRVLHAYGVSRDPEPLIFRMTGMVLTFAMIAIAALADLVLSVNGNLLT